MTEIIAKRGVISRIGICLLNLALPGLGLVRLARYRWASVFFLLVVASMGVILGGYCLIEHMSFGQWAAILGVVASLTLVALLGSIAASWRHSKLLGPRPGSAWRWYGILALWALSILATRLVPALTHAHYRTFYIAAASMLPTMQVDDRFVADMHDTDPIARGDLVIVRANGVDYVKRVAGVPGDKIAVVKGTVRLNGKPITQQFVEKTQMKEEGLVLPAEVLREQFPGEAKAHLVMDTGPAWLDDFAEVTLPPDRYFLLGDNRDHSVDSRLPPDADGGLGLLARSQITGRIAFRYWRSGGGLGPDRD